VEKKTRKQRERPFSHGERDNKKDSIGLFLEEIFVNTQNPQMDLLAVIIATHLSRRFF